MWHEAYMSVNGYDYDARYSDEAYEQVLRPLLERLAEIHAGGGARTVAFLAGPPAAGKSTLALLLEMLSQDLGVCDLLAVGLDGFHHRNEYLRSHHIVRDGQLMPLLAIKGAPETFDTEAFSRKLEELRAGGEVFWPEYDRTIHEPVEDAMLLTVPIVLIEGNWLLLDEEPWRSFCSAADLTIFLHAEESAIRERAIERKAKGGITREEAVEHYERSDGPNVRRVLEHSRTADVTITLTEDGDLRIQD